MKVLITKASDIDYEEIKEFKDWNELMEYLKRKYSSWVIEFNQKKIIYNMFCQDNKVDVEVTMYDDFIE